jgi:hypothetical protein
MSKQTWISAGVALAVAFTVSTIAAAGHPHSAANAATPVPVTSPAAPAWAGAGESPTTQTAVLVGACEDIRADVLCAYYDQDSHGKNHYWLYPHPQSQPNKRVVIAGCPTELTTALTCLWPVPKLDGFLVYVPLTLPTETD